MKCTHRYSCLTYSLQLLNFLARVYYDDISMGQKNLCYRPVRKDTGQRECWPMRMTAHKDKCPGGPTKAKAWEAHSLGRHGPRAAAFGHLINPFTAPACKISRLKKSTHSHTHKPANSIFSSPITNLFSILWVLLKILSHVNAGGLGGGGGQLKDFKFHTFLVVFKWWCGKHGSERAKFRGGVGLLMISLSYSYGAYPSMTCHNETGYVSTILIIIINYRPHKLWFFKPEYNTITKTQNYVMQALLPHTLSMYISWKPIWSNSQRAHA